MFRISCPNEKKITESFGFLACIYNFLYALHNINFYEFITIELSVGEKEKFRLAYLNNRRPFIFVNFSPQDFYAIDDAVSKKIFLLNTLHEILINLSETDHHIPSSTLTSFKETILKRNFNFAIALLQVANPKMPNSTGELYVVPDLCFFNFFVKLQTPDKQLISLIYSGLPSEYYINDLFYSGRWKGLKEFVIKGKRSEMQFHIYLESGKTELENITKSDSSPVFNMFKANAGSKELSDYVNAQPEQIKLLINNSLLKTHDL